MPSGCEQNEDADGLRIQLSKMSHRGTTGTGCLTANQNTLNPHLNFSEQMGGQQVESVREDL